MKHFRTCTKCTMCTRRFFSAAYRPRDRMQCALNVHDVHFATTYKHSDRGSRGLSSYQIANPIPPQQPQKRRSLPSQIAQRRRNPGSLSAGDPGSIAALSGWTGALQGSRLYCPVNMESVFIASIKFSFFIQTRASNKVLWNQQRDAAYTR